MIPMNRRRWSMTDWLIRWVVPMIRIQIQSPSRIQSPIRSRSMGNRPRRCLLKGCPMMVCCWMNCGP